MGVQSAKLTQLWIVSYPGGERRRFTNDLADYGVLIDVSHDGKALAAIQQARISHIWIAPEGQTTQAKQITSGQARTSGSLPDRTKNSSYAPAGPIWF